MHILMPRRRSVALLGTLLSILLMLAVVPRRADATTSPERSMIALINKARVSHGRAALRINDGLSDLARRHSFTMGMRNRLYHNPYLATWLADWSWKILGENVGVGPSVPSLHDAFMNSPPHRANIMDRRFRDVGVGIAIHGGRIWVTVIFRG